MLDMFVESLRNKKIDERDLKLLEVVGLYPMIEKLRQLDLYKVKLHEIKTQRRRYAHVYEDDVNNSEHLRDILESSSDLRVARQTNVNNSMDYYDEPYGMDDEESLSEHIHSVIDESN